MTGEGLSGEGTFELRSDDKEDMAAWRSGVEGSWQTKEHGQRPCGRDSLVQGSPAPGHGLVPVRGLLGTGPHSRR